MRKSYTTLFVLLTGAIVLMTSCREPKDLVFRDFNNLAVENIGFSSAKLSVDLVYYNPNNFGLELRQTDLDIFINGNFLGHSSQELQVAVPKRDVFTLPLKVDLDMKNLLKNGVTSLLNKKVTVKLVGKVKVGKGGVFKYFDVDYQTEQPLSLF